MDLGLGLANSEVFTAQNGARNVEKLVFLLTDGIQNPVASKSGAAWDPAVNARKLIDRGIKVFAIGVSDAVDKQELYRITGDNNKVFYADSFDALVSTELLDKASKAMCKATVPVVPTPADGPCT